MMSPGWKLGAASGLSGPMRTEPDDRLGSDVAPEEVLAGGEAGRGSEVELATAEAKRKCVAFELILRVEPARQLAWPQLGERLVAGSSDCSSVRRLGTSANANEE